MVFQENYGKEFRFGCRRSDAASFSIEAVQRAAGSDVVIARAASGFDSSTRSFLKASRYRALMASGMSHLRLIQVNELSIVDRILRKRFHHQ